MSNTFAKIVISTAATLALFIGGCAAHMANDQGASEMQSGYDATRLGLDRARDGLKKYGAGDKTVGRSSMRSGLAMMADGASAMRAGLAMMSDDMMRGCGGSATAMRPLVTAAPGGVLSRGPTTLHRVAHDDFIGKHRGRVGRAGACVAKQRQDGRGVRERGGGDSKRAAVLGIASLA